VVRKLQYNGAELNVGTPIPKNSTIDLVLGDGKKSSNSDDTDN